jgi:two-component system response regulator AtoC
LQALGRYDWPGNVRELANVLERAQILAEGDTVTVDDLPDSLLSDAPPAGDSGDPGELRAVERKHVLDVLRQHRGNKVHAARALGISRRALYRLISKYQLEGEKGEAAEQPGGPGAGG